MAVHEKSIVVDASVHQVFHQWRNLENLPRFMSHVQVVKTLDGNRSHWRGTVAGIVQEWDAEITQLEENKLIAWKSVSGFENWGEVRFEPLDGKTKITVRFEYEPPASIIGDAAEAVYVGRKFDEHLEEDLENFKRSVERRAA
jgi:uncharacterized membrane protein